MQKLTPSEMARVGAIIEASNKAGERLGQTEPVGVFEIGAAIECIEENLACENLTDCDYLTWVIGGLLKHVMAPAEVQLKVVTL